MVKAAYLEVGHSRLEPHSDLQVLEETNVPSPLNIVGSLRDREVACSASDRQSSNFESGGQCHLTILRKFSWPSLAYMCTNVA